LLLSNSDTRFIKDPYSDFSIREVDAPANSYIIMFKSERK